MTTYVRDYTEVPRLDGSKPFLALICGRKGSGKSAVAREIFTDYPHDKIVVDVTGDADPGPEAVTISPPFDVRMPGPREDGRPHVLRARIKASDPAVREHMDQAGGIALYPQTRPSLVWYDEWALVAGPNDTLPHARELITASRHHQASAIMCCPRPKAIATNSVGQADYLFMFPVSLRQDREMLAERIDTSFREFNRAMNNLGRRPPYWYLRWDRENGLVMCPPMPYTPTPHAKPS